MRIHIGLVAWALILSFHVSGQRVLEVRDADEGTPLPMATIRVAGENALSDLEGRWEIPASLPDTSSIYISYTGYPTRGFAVGDLARNNYVVNLQQGDLLLNQVVVFGRRGDRTDRVTAAVEFVSDRAIARNQSLTTADALTDLSGAYVQKSQFGGGSPILRGFEANRVLLVVDGVRLNNAIYRAGHLQNAITVDPLALRRMEVIYGAGSIAYGSDALGGVINFVTREPQIMARPRDAKLGGEAVVNFGTAARSFQTGIRLEYGGKQWAGITVASTTQTSDLRSGSRRPAGYPNFGKRSEYADRIDGSDVQVGNPDPNRQIGTGYNQYNLLQKFKYRPNNRYDLEFNLQASTTGDVPRYDALIEKRNDSLRWARWDYGPQTRLLASLKLTDLRETKLYDRATYQVSQQYIGEDRISRLFDDNLEETNEEVVTVSNAQMDFLKQQAQFTWRYGLDLRYDRVNSTAFQRDIVNGTLFPDGIPTRYPGEGSSLFASGAYLDGDFALNDVWRIRSGLRVATQRLHSTFNNNGPIEWPVSYLGGVTNSNTSLTGSLGVRHNGRNKAVRLLVAQGFRAPNVDDFSKFREQNGFILIPNPDLKPERSTTLEAGYEGFTDGGKFRAGIGLYHTWLTNAIFRGPGTLPNGDDFFNSRGEILRTQTNLNTESARIYGLDLFAKINIKDAWLAEIDLHALKGVRDQLAPDGRTLLLPQDHIPPPYGNASITYSRKKLSAGARIRFQLSKQVDTYAVSEITPGPDTDYLLDRLGTSDNLGLTAVDPRTGAFVGSLSWWTLNFFSTYELTEALSFRLKADNIFDVHYRSFSSGVSAPGVDVGVGLSWRF